jgi:hypothetical protein
MRLTRTKKELIQEIINLKKIIEKYEDLDATYSRPVIPMIMSEDGSRGIGTLRLTRKTLLIRIQRKYLFDVLHSLEKLKADDRTITFAFNDHSILGIGMYNEDEHKLIGHLIAPMSRK